MTLQLRFAALSDVGRVRKQNQDSGYAGPHLLAVADGVGGAARGDLASATAIQQLRRLDRTPGNDVLEQVAGAIHLTHDKLSDLVAESPEVEGTSTTITAALFDGATLSVAHVGDSRGYLLHDGEIRQLTKDHTFVQSLVDEGRITEDEARVHPHRNLILRAVDGVHEPEPDVFSVELAVGDRVLLCSDGCSGSVEDAQLARLLGDGDLDHAAGQLIRAALEGGSTDNVTVVLAEVVGADEDAEDDTASLPTSPLVVGAAAGATGRGGLGRPSLRRRRAAEPAPEPVDPETLRYAPRPPRRFVGLRRLALAVVVLALLALVGWRAYAWTQDQYYVGTSGGHVAIYRGVEADVPGLRMHTLVNETNLRLQDLPSHNARAVGAGLTADSLTRARAILHNLRVLACPPLPPPQPPQRHRVHSSKHPAPHHKKGAGHQATRHRSSAPRATGSARPSASASPSSTASPSPTRSVPPGADCSGVSH